MAREAAIEPELRMGFASAPGRLGDPAFRRGFAVLERQGSGRAVA